MPGTDWSSLMFFKSKLQNLWLLDTIFLYMKNSIIEKRILFTLALQHIQDCHFWYGWFVFFSLQYFTWFLLTRCSSTVLVVEDNSSSNIQLTLTSSNFKPEFIIKPVKHSNSVHVYFKGLSDMPRGFNIPCSLKRARYVDKQQKGLDPQTESNFHC